MELKTIIAIGLVVFIIGGLIFLKVRSRKSRDAGSSWWMTRSWITIWCAT